MTEADILATTYFDSCTVYRPGKVTLPTGESAFKHGLDGCRMYEDVPCALSSPSGGKLAQGKATAKIDTDYLLFTRPEVDIQPGDTVVVTGVNGRRVEAVAGLSDWKPSHNNVPLKLRRDTA